MLIDDEASVLVGLRLLIDWRKNDAEICGSFQNPVLALEAAKDIQPDLIITDIEMPEISGLDLIVYLQTACPGSTCVILSAYNDFQYAQRAIELGVFRYLLKPLPEDALLTLIKDVKSLKKAHPFNIEQAELRSLVVKEILVNGTDFHYSKSLPFYRDLYQKNVLMMVFLPISRDKAPDFETLRQSLKPICMFQSKGEFVLLLDASLNPNIKETLQDVWKGQEEIHISRPFLGLDTGHTILCDRKEKADSQGQSNRDEPSPLGNSQQAVQKAVEYIRAHYMEHDFRLSSVAEALYMNNSYLSYIFREKTGKTMFQYLLDVRMQEARELLRRADLSVAEIGYRVGYAIPNNFYGAFKKYYHESPRSYQKHKLMSNNKEP